MLFLVSFTYIRPVHCVLPEIREGFSSYSMFRLCKGVVDTLSSSGLFGKKRVDVYLYRVVVGGSPVFYISK